MLKIFRYIGRRIKYYRILFLEFVPFFQIKKDQKYGLLINTPIHGNLGDHAIAISTIKWLTTCYPDLSIIELTGEGYSRFGCIYKRIIAQRENISILFINGGGYLGDLWPEEENRVLDIVSTFKQKKIVIMPQTIYYDMNSQESRELCGKAKVVYEQHNDLIMCAREQESYLFMKKYFSKCDIIFSPDIVTIMSLEKDKEIRNEIIFCCRKDKERIVSDTQIEEIQNYIKCKFRDKKILHTDTVIADFIGRNNRRKLIDKKLREFARASLVVTDRLHGMLFATITETPCIVLESKSSKIRGVYEYIKNNKYILLLPNIDKTKMEEYCYGIKENSAYSYCMDQTIFMQYEQLENRVRELLQN